MKPTLVLLAAGMSTRYGRLKQLEPVGPGGEALLDYAVFDARRNGFNRVLLIIREELEETFQEHIKGRWPEDLEVIFHHQKITDLSGFKGGLDGREAEVSVLEGRTKPWGTGHALLSARAHLRSPFTLLNADDFYGAEAFHLAAEMIRDYSGIQLSDTVNADALHRPSTFGLVTYTLADTLSEHGGVSRGICTVDEGGWLGGIREVLEIDRDRDGLYLMYVSGQT
ncbi:MAG: NTP transferase domain-containing protein, partial [Gemmatimonadetes bacterium]|nr:NTP transferase domain-containing protein [Gemmatimonadota bacterium]